MASKRLLPTLSRSIRFATHSTPRTTTRYLATASLASSRRTPQNLSKHQDQPRPSTRSFTSGQPHRKEAPPPPTTYPPQEEFPSQSETNPPKTTSSEPPPSKIYTFPEIQSLSRKPSPNLLLIDVREPSELHSTGKIPGARNVPITSSPDAFFLSEAEFEDRFGFDRPGRQGDAAEGPGVEVVFYCKSGVRSKTAAELARRAGFAGQGRVGEYPGSWRDWVERGGEVEKV